MQVGEIHWIIFCLSTSTSVALRTYFCWNARKRALLVFETKAGPIPSLLAWTWFVPFYLTMIAYLVSPSWMRWATMSVPMWVQTLGAIGTLLTPLLCWWVLKALGDNFIGSFAAVFGQKLVERGPYRYVRHPLYATECFFLVSIALITANWIVLAFACSGIIIVCSMVIPQEEEYLVKRFGKTYENYRSRTGMLVPKLKTTMRSASCRRTDVSDIRVLNNRRDKILTRDSEASAPSFNRRSETVNRKPR